MKVKTCSFSSRAEQESVWSNPVKLGGVLRWGQFLSCTQIPLWPWKIWVQDEGKIKPGPWKCMYKMLLIFSVLKNMFIQIQYLMSFLCVIVITGRKELFTYSSCISLSFRPATIIFMAKITFSFSSQVLGSEKTVDISRRYNWFPAKWRLRIDNRNSILTTCHYPDQDSDTSSVWNFWGPFSGNQW